MTYLTRFDYGLGDNDFGSFHAPEAVLPLAVVNDGDLAAGCTNVGNMRTCGTVPAATAELLACLDDMMRRRA